MKEIDWIEIKKDNAPKEGRVLIYTPTEDNTFKYRIICVEHIKLATAATHFAILEPPKEKENE